MTRLACVSIYDFPLAVLVRDKTLRQNHPYVVAESGDLKSEVVHINKVASTDVSKRMSVVQANSRCVDLRIQVKDRNKEQGASRRLLAKLQQVSPSVQESLPGRYYLDLAGLGWIYRNESEIVRQIQQTLSGSSFEVQVGIAGSKLVSYLAALLTEPDSYTIIPPNGERDFLKPLSISVLPVGSESKQIMYTLGLKEVGDLARLPLNEITSRFGHDTLLLARYVRGEDPSTIVVSGFTEDTTSVAHLDYETNDLNLILAQIAHLLSQLLDDLKRLGEGCSLIVITFADTNGATGRYQVKLNRPSASMRRWEKQIQIFFEEHNVVRPISTIAVTVGNKGKLDSEQLCLINGLGYSNELSHEEVNDTSYFRVDPQVVAQAVLPEGSFFVKHEHRDTSNFNQVDLSQVSFSQQNLAGLRIFDPPRDIRVVVVEDYISSLGSGERKEGVVSINGPWHLSGHWWNGRYDRAYFEIITERNNLYLLYRDRIRSKWKLQGIYD